MVRYFDLVITVLGPILTKGAEPDDPGLDAVALRAPDGSLVISGKHIHGRCRHAAEEIAELADCTELKGWIVPAFGPDSTKKPRERESADWGPKRAALHFEELRCSTMVGGGTSARDFRLPKDDATGAGADQMLAVLEQAGGHAEKLAFLGKVRVVCDSEVDGRRQQAILLRTLRWLTSIGGQAGVGYGVIQNVSLIECKTAPTGLSGDDLNGESPETVDLDLTFAEPFCLAAPQLDENIFLCLEYVPGNALAGAIQRALGDVDSAKAAFQNLRRYFDAVRFRHAFPEFRGSEARPIPVPLSWVAIGPTENAMLFDAALVDAPALFSHDGKESSIPSFQSDWKSEVWKNIPAQTGWGKVEIETRMYTEIQRETGTAMDARLYAYQLVRPDRPVEDGPRELVRWRGSMDLSQINSGDRAKVIAELRDLLSQAPLLLGKTDARCSMAMRARRGADDPTPYPNDGTTDFWIVMLMTDTLLVDLKRLAGARQPELEQAYRDAWDEIGRQTLSGLRSNEPKAEASPFQFRHYYAEESLVGSDYLHHRFRANQPPYAPYLLTGAGSVFVLSSRPEKRNDVQDVFRKLLQEGLPLPSYSDAHWSKCPFVPQNGYGEIVVNHSAQMQRLHSVLAIAVEPAATEVCP